MKKGQIKDLSGKTFNRLTAIKPLLEKGKGGRTIWLCRCICGNYTNVPGTALSANRVKSCGCLKTEKWVDNNDIIGKRVNHWTILKFVEIDKFGERLYLCRCDCGTERNVRKSVLLRGKTKSCGCIMKKDLTSNIYGKYKVLRRSTRKNYWVCVCQCGKIKDVRGGHLIDGSTISCGCEGQKIRILVKRKDLRGRRFGKLLVVDFVEQKHKGHMYFLCRCDCGNQKIVRGSHLLVGNVKSCGCINSVGNYYIENIFNRLNISFEKEKKFEECRDKLPLRFDFYLEKYNLCIEYQGQQHYSCLKLWREKDTQKKFDDILKKDNIKRRFCLERNINLLEIPYWKKKYCEQIILDKIKEIENARN